MAIVRVDNQFQTLSPNTKLIAVRVTDIILDPSHNRFEDYGNYDSIGTIFYTTLNQSNPSTDSIAKPLFSFIKNYPLINETVLIMSSGDKDNEISTYYFPIINLWNHPHHNALPYIENLNNNSSADYEQNIARQVEDGSTGINLGHYFQEKLNIKPLLPYEGDTIIEGRFGNSIRFGSTNISDKVGTPNEWSNNGELGDPITIIRNGQSNLLDNKGWIHAKEDIMGDASSIYMTSNQQLSNFSPASLNQKSFGANLIEVKTLQQQLTGNYITPETSIIQPEFSTENSIEDTTESFESTPVTPTSTSSVEDSDDPFASYAEEILDGPGTMEIINISGTEDTGEDGIDESTGNSITNENLSYNTSIPSKRDSSYSVTLHTPEPIATFVNTINIQPASSRVEYLVIHTTAMALDTTHLDLAYYFMQLSDSKKGWRKHGYHITIDQMGECVNIYSDDKKSYGVGIAGEGSNKSNNIGNNNTINISWIGGAGTFDMTKKQAYSLNELVKLYFERYPGIKILGHNQIAVKSCPWFDVRKYCVELGIPSSNIYEQIPSGINLNKEQYNNHLKVANITM